MPLLVPLGEAARIPLTGPFAAKARNTVAVVTFSFSPEA